MNYFYDAFSGVLFWRFRSLTVVLNINYPSVGFPKKNSFMFHIRYNSIKVWNKIFGWTFPVIRLWLLAWKQNWVKVNSSITAVHVNKFTVNLSYLCSFFSLSPPFSFSTTLSSSHSSIASLFFFSLCLPSAFSVSIIKLSLSAVLCGATAGDLQTTSGTPEDVGCEDLDWEEEREMERLACEGDDFIPPKIIVCNLI